MKLDQKYDLFCIYCLDFKKKLNYVDIFWQKFDDN